MELLDAGWLLAQVMEERSRFPIKNTPDLVAVIAVGGPMLCFLSWIILHSLGKAGRCLVDAVLKYRMLRLGYSAAEIERVLRADSQKRKSEQVTNTKSEIVVAETIKPIIR